MNTKDEENQKIIDYLIDELNIKRMVRYTFMVQCNNYKLSYILEGLAKLEFEIISTDNTELYNAQRESLQLIILRHKHIVIISIKRENGKRIRD
jgi:hypothetical protein